MAECTRGNLAEQGEIHRPQCDLAPYLPPFRLLAPSGARAGAASLCHFAIRKGDFTAFDATLYPRTQLTMTLTIVHFTRRFEQLLGFRV